MELRDGFRRDRSCACPAFGASMSVSFSFRTRRRNLSPVRKAASR